MRKSFTMLLMIAAMLTGCGANTGLLGTSLFDTAKIIGQDIQLSDITDFYYTKENINYNAYYQRYRFYTENGKYKFFHETRERKNDYGPCTKNDIISQGTIELTEDQWAQFTALLFKGTVKTRKNSTESGDTGPWLYLYWKSGKKKCQQFQFASYDLQEEFVDFCLSLE